MGADGIRHELHYVAESSYGVTPTSPSFLALRGGRTTLGISKTEIQSNELFKDRMERVSRHGIKRVAGDLPIELSFASFDALFGSVFQSSFTAGVTLTATDISAAASDNSINSAGAGFGSFSAGMVVVTSGFTGTAGNNGTAVITSATSSKLILSGITLVDDSAGESVTVTQFDAMKPGVTRSSVSIIRDFEDITTGRYHVATGVEASAVSLSLQPDAMITGSFTLVGQNVATSDSAPSGATFANPNNNDVFDSFTGFIRDNAASLAVGTSLELSIASALSEKTVLFSDTVKQAANGKFTVTGTLTAHFESTALYDKFIDEEESSLLFIADDPDGNRYGFWMPKVKYNGGQPDVSGEGSVTLALTFRAIYDATLGASVAMLKMSA